MAVSVDTVYQKVLALANKEQRGYVTPQEFNLFANHAQMEIFEQYFYDIKQFNRIPGNSQEFSDSLSMLYEKIGIFDVEQDDTWMTTNMPVITSPYITIPNEIYKIGSVRVNDNEVELLNSKDYDIAKTLPLTAPSLERPIGHISNRGLRISIGDNFANPVPGGANPLYTLSISYITRPDNVQWGYVVVNEKALYNDNISLDFQLHQSEETKLVYKILKLAGISIEDQQLAGVAAQEEQLNIQQENK